jgi:hypothetical protein
VLSCLVLRRHVRGDQPQAAEQVEATA